MFAESVLEKVEARCGQEQEHPLSPYLSWKTMVWLDVEKYNYYQLNVRFDSSELQFP